MNYCKWTKQVQKTKRREGEGKYQVLSLTVKGTHKDFENLRFNSLPWIIFIYKTQTGKSERLLRKTFAWPGRSSESHSQSKQVSPSFSPLSLACFLSTGKLEVLRALCRPPPGMDQELSLTCTSPQQEEAGWGISRDPVSAHRAPLAGLLQLLPLLCGTGQDTHCGCGICSSLREGVQRSRVGE